jgi:hypothetical protein
MNRETGQHPWRAVPSSEGGQKDEWAAYVVLDMYNEDVPRDHLQGASPTVTECVLSVIRERGRKGLPLERLYQQLFNKALFLLACGRIYSNQGAMTPGVTTETMDGMSLAKIDTIIEALRSESYRWSPARRVYIPEEEWEETPAGDAAVVG